jgi:hypothetical protein
MAGAAVSVTLGVGDGVSQDAVNPASSIRAMPVSQ